MLIRQLVISDKPALDELIAITEQNLFNKLFWLPIDDISREHFFDYGWTKFYGAFIGNRLVSAAGVFIALYEFIESYNHIQHLQLRLDDTVELGRIMTRPEFRGNGIATEVARRVLQEASWLGKHSIIATAHPDNAPSNRLLQTLGFKYATSYIKSEGYPRNVLVRQI